MKRPLLILLGNQLFAPNHLKAWGHAHIFMAEDWGLCTYVRHHQQKIVLFLAAMRTHAETLEQKGWELTYRRLDDDVHTDTFEQKLLRCYRSQRCDGLVSFEIEDRFMETRIQAMCASENVEWKVLPSPMFVRSRAEALEAVREHQPARMADFYKTQRRTENILLDTSGKPIGGRWSFDAENRRKLPKDLDIPKRWQAPPSPHVSDVQALVREHFSDHPGEVDHFWLPTTRKQALHGLRDFLNHFFAAFGDYEDALSQRDPFLFHSILTPALNLGLLTPKEVLTKALQHAEDTEIPLNALEGFVRQILGWREFIRAIYHAFDDVQQTRNFWGHKRRLTPAWYRGDTGIPLLDAVIKKAQRWGYAHHIERLMVLGNMMTLCEIEPGEAHRWFMEMFVDSSDWVMGPNVYGMGLFSDGGVFATKPYICGSNYWLKMSDESRGPWCDIVDGLYWRFIDKHRDFFTAQPRLAVMPRTLDKMASERKKTIFRAAENALPALAR